MKKINGMMVAKSKTRKFHGKCEKCGVSICSCKAYCHVDGDNIAITNNSPYLCKDCFEKWYGVRIKTDVDIYKKKLMKRFMDYKIDTADKNEKKFIDIAIKLIMFD